jgi:hypothetical protein
VPQVKYTTSILGLSIVNSVKQFLLDNANAIEDDASVTPTQGTEMLANAICYAISKAMASPSFVAALNAGLGPATAGPLINSTLAPSVIEL